MTLYTEIAADQTDHFVNALVRENVAHDYDVLTMCAPPILCTFYIFGSVELLTLLRLKHIWGAYIV